MALDAKGHNLLYELVVQAIHTVYFYVALSLRVGLQDTIGPEYETFGLELLAFLQKWRHVYSQPPELPEAPDPPEDPS
jgi:hypothetical protein